MRTTLDLIEAESPRRRGLDLRRRSVSFRARHGRVRIRWITISSLSPEVALLSPDLANGCRRGIWRHVEPGMRWSCRVLRREGDQSSEPSGEGSDLRIRDGGVSRAPLRDSVLRMWRFGMLAAGNFFSTPRSGVAYHLKTSAMMSSCGWRARWQSLPLPVDADDRANASKRKATRPDPCRRSPLKERLKGCWRGLLGAVDGEEDERYPVEEMRGHELPAESPLRPRRRDWRRRNGRAMMRARTPGQGRNPQGRPAVKRAYGEPEPKAQSNFTDPESRNRNGVPAVLRRRSTRRRSSSRRGRAGQRPA